MTFEQWEEKYKPITVTEGELFTFDYAELNHPRRTARNLWTVIEGDDDGIYITNDFHFVNRLGYVLTEVDFEGQEDLTICYLSPDDFEPSDEETEEIVVGA